MSTWTGAGGVWLYVLRWEDENGSEHRERFEDWERASRKASMLRVLGYRVTLEDDQS